MNGGWKPVVYLKPNSHLLEGFDNGVFDLVDGFDVPVDWHICPYISQERANLLVEVAYFDDNFSAHLSLPSTFSLLRVIPGMKNAPDRKMLNSLTTGRPSAYFGVTAANRLFCPL